MKKAILIFLLLICVPFTTYAAEDSAKREVVEQLLKSMKAEQMIEQMYSQMDKMFAGLGQQLGISESEMPIFDKFMKKVVQAMKQEMTWERMKEPMIQIYLKHYTEKELKDVAAFYNTESGQAMIKKMPVVMQESMMISQSMYKDFMPKIQELSVELKNELQAARNNKSK